MAKKVMEHEEMLARLGINIDGIMIRTIDFEQLNPSDESLRINVEGYVETTFSYKNKPTRKIKRIN